MPTLVWNVPVFDFFSTYEHGLDAESTIHSGQKCIGKVTNLETLDRLVPAIWHHIEINRDEGEEEVRIVDSKTGDYYQSTLPESKVIIAELDARTAQLFSPNERAFPPDAGMGEEKEGEFQKAFIMYDHERCRILPPIRHAGTLDTLEDYRAKDGGFAVWYEVDEFVGVADTRTGEMWWVTEEVKARVLEVAKDRPDGCPLDEREG
ncbi:hypothetical protein IAT40_007382 [Kwoniella sp. CBS 6097]